MALFEKSGNPALQESMFQRTIPIAGEGTMTFRGTMNKFIFVFLLTMCSAAYSWFTFQRGGSIGGLMALGTLGGFALAIIMSFKMNWAQYLAPAYGLCEGLFLGSISAYMNNMFAAKAPYLVAQAVLLTFGVVLAMWLLYRTQIIKVNNKLIRIIVGATLGIGIFYLLSMVLGFFHVTVPFISFTDGSTLSIGFSLVVVAVAALNLLLDFDMIDKGAQFGAPKYMEWYGAFALMVTIVWLYLEILRLLAKFNSRD